MRNTAGSSREPDRRADNYLSVVTDLTSLIERIQASIEMLEPVIARALLLENGAGFESRHARGHRGVREQRFKADELVAILLENRRGKCLAADDEHGLAVFLEFVDQRNEVAIAADDGEGVDMRMREGHLQSVDDQVAPHIGCIGQPTTRRLNRSLRPETASLPR